MGEQKDDYSFATGAVPAGKLRLLGFWGVEELSRVSTFELLIQNDDGPLSDDEVDKLFRSPCGLAMGPDKTDIVRGLVTRVRSIDSPGDVAHYIVSMAPTVHLLELGRNSRVFQEQTVPEIAASIFAEYGLSPEVDYRIRVVSKPIRREFVAQYQESDWDFLQRWFEHEGYFYWFEHGKGGDCLMLADNNNAAPEFEERHVRHRDRNNLGTAGERTIFEWGFDDRRVPAKVVVMDYNYRAPRERIVSRALVDGERGFGTVVSYAEHVKNSDEGDRVATMRAERYRAERRTFAAKTDCAGLRAGVVFDLSGHREREHDRRYLITRIEHRGGAPVPGTPHTEEGLYAGSLRCLPGDIPFRPERSTPWPSIHGFMHGHIAGDSDGTYAEMDEYGRYKVKLPFDTRGTKNLSASRWIRMVQSYAGSAEGTHQPLRKGTEVMIIFLDGDPDRPVILGAVPNMHTVSPTNKANATQAVVRTPSGIRIEIEDKAARRST